MPVKFTPCRQPKDGGVADQVPVIRMQGQFYSMSLRMMKAVWCVAGNERVFFPCGVFFNGCLAGATCG